MNSENIYIQSKLKLEGQKFNDPDNNPLKTYYEYSNVSHFETAFFMPCHINFMGRYIYKSGFQIKRGAISIYDIIYIYNGELNIHYKNKNYTAIKGDVFFIHSDTNYEITSNSSDNVDVLFLSNNGIISKEYYNMIIKKGFKAIHIKKILDFNDIFEKLVFYIKYPSIHNNALAIDTIMHLFTELYLNAINVDDYDNVLGHPKWFVKTIAMIDENYSKNITIEKLASNCDLSASHLYKLFREYTGTSPYNYLLNVRINNAKSFLSDKDLTVKYIAHSVGFKSVNLFINHFKKMTGSTPNSYRLNH